MIKRFLKITALVLLIASSVCSQITVEETYDSGQLKAKGQVEGDEKIGVWTAWYEDGTKMTQGTYLSGKRDGKWEEWYEKETPPGQRDSNERK